MADIFISYASIDRPRIEPLVRALQAQKWSVWYDRELRPGAFFRQQISKELVEARCVVVAWSKSALESGWVSDEAQEARDRGIMLVPVRLEAVDPPLGFRGIHTADLSKWYGNQDHEDLKRLLSHIGEILGRNVTTGGINPPHVGASKNDSRSEIMQLAAENLNRIVWGLCLFLILLGAYIAKVGPEAVPILRQLIHLL